MARLAQILLLSAVLGLVFGGGAARAQECSVSDGESIVQGLLDDVIAPFNAAWPAICEASGLDPFDNVFDGSVNLGCGLGDLGNTVCGLQASSCKSMWADVDVSQITGLENLDLTSLTVTSTNASDGTSCPYKSSAVDGTSFSCSYSGEGTGTAALTGTMTADLSSIEIRVECDALGGLDDFKETIWEGHATATATSGTADADIKYCSGICSVDSGVASLVYLAMSDLKLKLDGVSVNIVTDGSSYNIDADLADEIADTIADALKTDIEAALSPVVSSALNDEVDEIIPLPSSCSSAAASSTPAAAPAAAVTAPTPPGSFVCYDAGLAAGSAAFTSFNNLTLTDARETSRNAIVREAQLCNPLASDPGAAPEPQQHFVGYVLRPEFGAPDPQLPAATLSNAFGVQQVSFGEALPDMLFSSAAASAGALDVGCILAPGAYRCTAAQGAGGAASGQVVRLKDDFDDRLMRVASVRAVCAPLSVDGVAPARSDRWLACYTTVPASGPLGPSPAAVTDVSSEFGSQLLGPLGADRRLCVPTDVKFSVPAPTTPRLGVDAGGRSSGGIGFVGNGASCPLVRPHLDPGLGIFERAPILGIFR